MSSSRKVLAVWSMAKHNEFIRYVGSYWITYVCRHRNSTKSEIAMAAQLSARNTVLMALLCSLEGSAIALRLMEGGIEPEIDLGLVMKSGQPLLLL